MSLMSIFNNAGILGPRNTTDGQRTGRGMNRLANTINKDLYSNTMNIKDQVTRSSDLGIAGTNRKGGLIEALLVALGTKFGLRQGKEVNYMSNNDLSSEDPSHTVDVSVDSMTIPDAKEQ